jgi:tetratricopeptide (TPR) repeat protein
VHVLAGILENVRWSVLLPVVLASASAAARPVAGDPTPEPDKGSRFWRAITDPNGDQVEVLINKARRAMLQPDDALARDEEWAVDQRMRFYRDAYNLLRHAHKLAPENLEALKELARAADELGKTREALDALQAAVRVTGADKADWEITGRLGMIRLRLGETDDAIRWLRLAQSPAADPGERAELLVHLANALAARGEVAAAIHTLSSALPDRAKGYAYEATLVTFALAVIYDRDEQRASAFEVLDRMQSGLQGELHSKVRNEIARFRFAPPEDLHYYRGLLYEALGQYVEARAEWALYAAAGPSPWRGRALDHIAAIDAQRRTPTVTTPPTPAPPVLLIRRRLPKP